MNTIEISSPRRQPDAILCPSSPRSSRSTIEIWSPRKTVTRSAAPPLPPPPPQQKVVAVVPTTFQEGSSSVAAAAASKAQEVGYFANPTALSRLIHDHKYNEALRHLQECPQEASVWLVAKREDKSSSSSSKTTTKKKKDYWIRTLPIHMACRNLRDIKEKSALLDSLNEVIVSLTVTYPRSCREKDHQGMLPLHISILYGASPDTISCFLTTDPKSLHSRDRKGCTLIELNNHESLGHGDDYARQQQVEELLVRPMDYWEQASYRLKIVDEMNDSRNELEQDTRLPTCRISSFSPDWALSDDEISASEFLDDDEDEDDGDDDEHDYDGDDVSDSEMPSASGASVTEDVTEVCDLLSDYVVPVAIVEKLKEKAETCEIMLKDMESRNNELLEKNQQLQEGRMRQLGALDRANVTQMAADIARCQEENGELKEQLKAMKKILKKSDKKSSKNKKGSSSSKDKKADKSKNGKDKTKDKTRGDSPSKSKKKSKSSCESSETEAVYEVNEKEEKKLKKLQRKQRKMKQEYREMSKRYKQQSSLLLGLVDTVETLLLDSPAASQATTTSTGTQAASDNTLKKIDTKSKKTALSDDDNDTLVSVSDHAPKAIVEEKKRKSKRRSSMGDIPTSTEQSTSKPTQHLDLDSTEHATNVSVRQPHIEKKSKRRSSMDHASVQQLNSSNSIPPPPPIPPEKKKAKSQRRSSMGNAPTQQVDSSSSGPVPASPRQQRRSSMGNTGSSIIPPPPPSPPEKKNAKSQRRSSMGNTFTQQVDDSSSSGPAAARPRQQRRSSMGNTESIKGATRRRESVSNTPLQNDPSSDDLNSILNKAVQQQHKKTRSPWGKKERCRMKIEPVLSNLATF
jgi:hypothetical protein